MHNNPALYEINTRVWIKRFGKDKKLPEVPAEYFRELAGKGIDIIWLMGIWETTPRLIEECCFSPELVSAYNKGLNDWKREDIIGSPYSINKYQINPALGTPDDLRALRELLNNMGMKLLLDFVPNHFSAASSLIEDRPEIFLPGDAELLNFDPLTFFRPKHSPEKILAHGRDPFFPAWSDTVQLNYYNPDTRKFMTGELLKLADICDGVRCDMSILQLNNVFTNTWSGVLNKLNYPKPATEFWKDAIAEVKRKKPDFLFVGEAYWDLEWELQQLGFDFTYDKRLMERLLAGDVYGVNGHLDADINYQEKSVRFLENHDEPRAVSTFGKQKSMAAAVVMSTVPGMSFYFDGQFEGKKNKLPLQLGREPLEKECPQLKKYYNDLLNITKNEVFKSGTFKKLEAMPAGEGNYTYEDILCWQWTLGEEKWIIVTNYSDKSSQCRISFRADSPSGKIRLLDNLTGITYPRNTEELLSPGLFVELKAYRSHIFSVI